MNKSPAFQFYPAEFLSDENVVLMSNQELGCYIKLMCFCWREGSIPANINQLARLCGEDSSAMAQLWLSLSKCFSVATNDPERLVHARLEREREKQERYRSERSEAGKKGAKAHWNKDLAVDSSAIAQPYTSAIANDSSLSLSSSSSSTSSTSIKTKVKNKRDALFDFPLPDFINREKWVLWMKVRPGKILIAEQAQSHVNNLIEWHGRGLDANAALAKSADNSYQGLFEPKPTSANGTRQSSHDLSQIDYGTSGKL